MNILVTGSNGLLGHEFKKISENFKNLNFIFTDKESLNISSINDIKRNVIHNNIDLIINLAAYTDVKKAEIENQLCNEVNNIYVNNLIEICNNLNIKLVHISTNYVFDGKKNKPYKELDKVNPLNFYGKTKLYGEQNMIKNNLKDTLIIRTSYLYSALTENNLLMKFVNKIKENENINISSDSIISPTNAADLAHAILTIIPKISNHNCQLFHFANSGSCSVYDFASEINNFLKGNINIKINDLNKDYEIDRPKYSVLDNRKFMSYYNLVIPHWKKSLHKSLENSCEI